MHRRRLLLIAIALLLRRVIERIKGGTALFAYYPDSHWLRTSRFLRCDERAGT